MDRPLTKAQFHRATWLAAGFFSESIAAELRQKPCPPHGYHDPTIIDAILSSAHMETFQDLSLRQCCRSVKKFLRAVGEVFSNEILDHFPERAKHFDKISGVRGLSDAFMEQKSAQEFVLDIVDAISDVVSELAREELPASPAPSITPTPSTFEEPLEDPRCQVVEIQLEGPTIRDAWDANAKTRHLEKPATLAAGLTPKDTEFQSLPAFHGTGPLRGLNQEDKLAERLGYIFTGGGHRHQQTQVAPTYDCLPVVSTTFSPLRAFLWAVFYSTVIQSVPIAGYEARGEKPWECLGHAHAGATVCEFRPSIVASKDPYQTVYSIPEGRESAWYQVVQHLDALPKAKLTTLPTPSLLWEQFSQLHGGAGKGWPNIIHCKEFGAVRKTLSSCVQQPWRSVWTDISIDLLNKSHVQTYSITFKQKDRTSPPPVQSLVNTVLLAWSDSGYRSRNNNTSGRRPDTKCSVASRHAKLLAKPQLSTTTGAGARDKRWITPHLPHQPHYVRRAATAKSVDFSGRKRCIPSSNPLRSWCVRQDREPSSGNPTRNDIPVASQLFRRRE